MKKEYLEKLKEARKKAIERYGEKAEKDCHSYEGISNEIFKLVINAIACYDYYSDSFSENPEDLKIDESYFGVPTHVSVSNHCEDYEKKLKRNRSYIKLVYMGGTKSNYGFPSSLSNADWDLVNDVLRKKNIEVTKLSGRGYLSPCLIIAFNNSALNMRKSVRTKGKVKKKVYKRYVEEELKKESK